MTPIPLAWTGWYLGVQGGGAWARSRWDSDFNCTVGVFCDAVSNSPSGWIFGGQLGHRWQFAPSWVVGVEVTGAFANLKGSSASTCTPGVNTCIGVPGGFGVTYETKVSSLFTATGQIGYAWSRALLYAKGGWAGGHVERNNADTLGETAATVFQTIKGFGHGYTVGAGLDYMLWQRFTLGVEYGFIHLTNTGLTGRAITGTGVLAFVTNDGPVTVNIHQVVARLNYAFGPIGGLR